MNDDEDYDDEFYTKAIKKGIINDEDDDFRILDSLPIQLGFKPQQIVPEKPKKAHAEQTLKTPAKANADGASLKKESLLTRCLDSLVVTGFNANAIPAITNLTYFMNLSFALQKHGLQDQVD